MSRVYDTIVIGGGFFGMTLAEYVRSHLGQQAVLVLEKESRTLTHASLHNQARVHNGYHYPRSMLTALRSRVNFPRFVADFEPAIKKDFDKYYAVARHFSKVSAGQFRLFCERIEADIEDAPKDVVGLFDRRFVESVYKVKEYAFDADIIRGIVEAKIERANVSLHTDCEVVGVKKNSAGLIEVTDSNGKTYTARHVLNCTYSMLNKLNHSARLPTIPLKHELAEMALVSLPKALESLSVTVMCGPFFSFMPFPSRGLHTLSHVRYTPHSAWQDSGNEAPRDNHIYLKNNLPPSNFKKMLADAARFMPTLSKSRHEDSLWEVKTVLPQSEGDDSRPILFKPHHGLRNYTCILGGKLDNIYDAFRELEAVYA